MHSFRVLLIAVVSSLVTASLFIGYDAFRGERLPVAVTPTQISQDAAQAIGKDVVQILTPIAPPVPAVPAQAIPPAPAAKAAPRAQTVDPVIRVYRDVSPSVVTVISSTVRPGFRSEPTPTGTGSGFMIDNEGRILTNNHVVEDANRLEVSLPDGSTIPADLVGRDPRFDLAVIKANIPANLIRPVTLGDSDQIEVGEQAIAIGNPYGLERTVTTGVISARRPVVQEPNSQGIVVNAIQTDAAINPGNSGGPLLNARGEVIGINSLGRLGQGGGQAGLNFAIPINSAKRVLPDLIAKGSYAHPFVGISSTDITQAIAQQLNLPVQEGLLVQTVDPNSGAARAGVRGGSAQQDVRSRQIATGGDVVVAIDGNKVRRPEDFVAYLELNKKAGEQVTLTVLRDGQQRDVAVVLGERPRP